MSSGSEVSEPGSPDARGLNKNVKLSLWFNLLETASSSVRAGDALSAYVFLVTKSNAAVGYVQGFNGIAQMLCALPAGWAADHGRRDATLRVAAGVGALAALALAVALVTNANLLALGAAVAALGAWKGLATPPAEAIFADSVVTGSTAPYTWKWAVSAGAGAVGPALSMVLFGALGNEWRAADCRAVLLAGLVSMAPPLAVACMFDDDATLGRRSEALTPSASSASLRSDAEAGLDPADPASFPPAGFWPRLAASLPQGVFVAGLIFASDLAGALASGMTLKFFSMFFLQACGLGPVAVSAVGTLAPATVAVASVAAGRAARSVGRLPLALITRALDVCLLVGMAYMPTPAAGQATTLATPSVAALVAIHIVRMAAANAARPLVRAILMEHVPKRHRAKVNALDSVRTFSWSGSAAIGGWLIERCGFGDTFLLTAAVKLAAMAPLLPLLAVVGDDGGGGGERGAAPAAAAPSGRPRSAARVGARGARAPLLPPAGTTSSAAVPSDSVTSSPLALGRATRVSGGGGRSRDGGARAASPGRAPPGAKRVHRNDSSWSLRL